MTVTAAVGRDAAAVRRAEAGPGGRVYRPTRGPVHYPVHYDVLTRRHKAAIRGRPGPPPDVNGAAGNIMSADDGPPDGNRKPLLALLGLGMTNAACLLGGAGLGWLLDSRFGTTPLFILVGLFSGIVVGVLASYVQIRNYFND